MEKKIRYKNQDNKNSKESMLNRLTVEESDSLTESARNITLAEICRMGRRVRPKGEQYGGCWSNPCNGWQ